MQHSYEGLDHAGGFSRIGLLLPLRHRDFRRLWAGMCISLLGDGVFMVALAWQVYAISNAPTALATVGITMSVPTIACLLIGGAVSDRFDRRHVMLYADVARAVALAGLALLAATHELRLWHLLVICVVYGVATAFFDPAFDALVPEVLPPDQLAGANSLDQLIRPLALRLAGPALGGAIVAALGTGGAFAFDAVSFEISAFALFTLWRHGPARSSGGAGLHREIGDGLRYVCSHAWLWATFASAAVAYLLFMGPTEVLLPYVVKNVFAGGPGELGLVYGAGGLASLLCALTIGQRGLPDRPMTFVYCAWSAATVAIAGYGLARGVWALMLTSVVFNALETGGTIVWATLKQRHVPAALLGRVSSLDWLISIGLLPVSFAITGPAAAALGFRATLVGAGLLGGVVTIAALWIPGVRELDAGSAPSPRTASTAAPLAGAEA